MFFSAFKIIICYTYIVEYGVELYGKRKSK